MPKTKTTKKKPPKKIKRAKKKLATYTLDVHWKQGDEFNTHLAKYKGDPFAAMRAWANDLRARAGRLDDIAERISGRHVCTHGYGHAITLWGQSQDGWDALAKLAKAGLIHYAGGSIPS